MRAVARQAVAALLPALADARVDLSDFETSNPEWCVGTAIVDGSFVVKYAWSDVAAARIRREARVLTVLERTAPKLPVPRVEAFSETPAAFATRLVAGEPLRHVPPSRRASIAEQLGQFLAGLHQAPVLDEVAGLVEPLPQGTTGAIRERLPHFLDGRRAALLAGWCDWVDHTLDARAARNVFVHGDFHGFNQVWDDVTTRLRLVADFEVAGPADPEYDFRYLPQMGQTLDFVEAVARAYEQPIDVSRVLAWSMRTALGDALWRSEAGIPLPFGSTPASYVDDIERKLRLAGV